MLYFMVPTPASLLARFSVGRSAAATATAAHSPRLSPGAGARCGNAASGRRRLCHSLAVRETVRDH